MLIRYNVDMKFGQMVKAAREKAGRPVDALARELDVTTAFIYDVEKGARHFSLERVVAVAAFLGTDPEPLITSLVAEIRELRVPCVDPSRAKELGTFAAAWMAPRRVEDPKKKADKTAT
jgi:transcriptional regulator with XRE-family HTH domain